MAHSLPIDLDPQRATPLYAQLIEQIKYLLASGDLRPQDELPSVRSLAERFLINPNTVVRAYQELEREGLVYKKRGMGTYISDEASRLGPAQRRKIVGRRLRDVLREARQLGLNPDEVRAELDKWIDKTWKKDE